VCEFVRDDVGLDGMRQKEPHAEPGK
jgi:hypothetical protein